jgi:hypothetical protein
MDNAFDWCEKAIDAREPLITHLGVNPIFDSLRSYPRYQTLLRKMNLQP